MVDTLEEEDLKCSMRNFMGDLEPYEQLREWMNWLRDFKLFLGTKSSKLKQKSMLSLMLNKGGKSLAELHEIIPGNTDGKDSGKEYDAAVKRFEKHFRSQVDVNLLRKQFRSSKQGNESVATFIMKLRKEVKICQYDDEDREFEEILNAISDGAKSKKVQKKAIAALSDTKLTLDELTNYATKTEHWEQKCADDEKQKREQTEISAVKRARFDSDSWTKRDDSGFRKTQVCFACNKEGHIAREKSKCAASNKECRDCKKRGHFSGSRFCDKATSEKKNVRGRYPNNKVNEIEYDDDAKWKWEIPERDEKV